MHNLTLGSESDILVPKVKKPRENAPFTICHRFSLGFTTVLAIISFGVVSSSTGIAILLPLTMATFSSGGYFIVWLTTLCFAVSFIIPALIYHLKGMIPKEMRQWRWHKYIVLIGLFDCLNNILLAYASPLSRNPGILQSILIQAYIPCALVFSKIVLNKHYTSLQILGAVLVLGGVGVSLVPTFREASSGVSSDGDSAATWWWPLIYILSNVPSALTSICCERLQDTYREEMSKNANIQETSSSTKQNTNCKRFSVIYYQAWESTYAWLWVNFFMWSDFIPGFGFDTDISMFKSDFDFSMQCFFRTPDAVATYSLCSYAAPLMMGYVLSSVATYAFYAEISAYASANLGAIVAVVSPIMSMVFWYIFPSVNAWAGGSSYDITDLWFNLGALPLIFAGIALYRYFEQEDKTPDEEEISSGGVELCF